MSRTSARLRIAWLFAACAIFLGGFFFGGTKQLADRNQYSADQSFRFVMALSRQAGGDLGSLKAGDRSCIEKARAWLSSNPGPYQTEAFAIGLMNLPYGHRLTDKRTGEQLLFQWIGGDCRTVGIYNASQSR